MNLIDRFRQGAIQAGATLEVVRDGDEARRAIARLGEEIGARSVTATRDGARFAPPGALIGSSPSEVADADLGVSVALLAVAETGSVLLGSTVPTDRLVGLLALTHAIVVPRGALENSLDDAARQLRTWTMPGPGQLRYAAFTTGPSRTADIERVLTIGVQGPRALHLVVVEGD
ncbi:MAG TPA: LUD domain-containing protein [Candidatus Limnocylindrales bacterium]|nr:LUD domain-containing protein [Candidatus Limnocylindrales bacterium]